jgi:hypothetical protein
MWSVKITGSKIKQIDILEKFQYVWYMQDTEQSLTTWYRLFRVEGCVERYWLSCTEKYKNARYNYQET